MRMPAFFHYIAVAVFLAVLTACGSGVFTTQNVGETVVIGPPVSSYSLITSSGTTPANGTSTATVTITLKDANNRAVSGLIPAFSATDTGTSNVYGTCTATNSSGISTCTLASNMAETKTLQLTSPISLSGGSVTFNQSGMWMKIAGDSVGNAQGVYGTMGVADSANKPGGRHSPCTWVDSNNDFWVFGGYGRAAAGTVGHLNDLWKYSGGNWTWVGGSNTVNTAGVYGTKGVAANTNWPGGRGYFACWKDSSNNIWFYGGNGRDSAGTSGNLSDLWRWDGTNWTWMAGSNLVNEAVVFGTRGVAAGTNTPGRRNGSVGWSDSNGNQWVAMGWVTTTQMYGDIWKFDGTNWTWVAGDVSGLNSGLSSSGAIYSTAGVYGTKGVAASTNYIGSHIYPMVWLNNSGHVMFFGGYGCDVTDCTNRFNRALSDQWKWDGTDWTWISGTSAMGTTGVYGTKGVASSSGMPGARYKGALARVSDTAVYTFGGLGYDSAGNFKVLNDFWKWDGTQWTWLTGSDTGFQATSFPSSTLSYTTNTPSSRQFVNANTDSNGNVWLFGGNGCDSSGCTSLTGDTQGYYLNDLWKYTP